MSGRRTSVFRGVLIGVVPLLLLVVGAYLIITGGRYVRSDNAYVKAATIQISPEIDGRVIAVPVHENQEVTQGDLLFSIDRRPFEIKLAAAEAGLATVRQKIAALRAHYSEGLTQIQAAEERISYLQLEVARQSKLKASGFGAGNKFEQAEHELVMETRNMAARVQRNQMVLAELNGNLNKPLDNHPLYLAELALRDDALLNLARTKVLAPVSGRISKLSLQPGEHVEAGEAVFALVDTSHYWVQVNIKEVKLTHLKAGQKASVVLDAYPDVTWDAVVESISPSTGAEFSLLPAQNATGNWVKIVQRVPIRLKLVVKPSSPILRAGLTATVAIDTERENNLATFAATLLKSQSTGN